MSENLPTNVELNSGANGTVSFASDVIATIAGLAATEVDGVTNMTDTTSRGLVDILRKNQTTRSLTKGVRVEAGQNQVAVHLTVTVDYGVPIPKVVRNIQDNVKKAVETMTGLTVTEINIYVPAVSFDKENRAVAELQQKHMLQQIEMRKKQETETSTFQPVKNEEPKQRMKEDIEDFKEVSQASKKATEKASEEISEEVSEDASDQIEKTLNFEPAQPVEIITDEEKLSQADSNCQVCDCETCDSCEAECEFDVPKDLEEDETDKDESPIGQ